MPPISHCRVSLIIVCTGLAAAILMTHTDTIGADDVPASYDASLALITIPNPKEVSLFQLHGYSGAGTISLRIDDQCHSMAVRLIAGDFEGRLIGIAEGEPILLLTTRPEIVQALYDGQDLVSEDFEVLAGMDGETADIVIVAGLSAETGFLLNPGRSVLADIFGARSTPIPCLTLNRTRFDIQLLSVGRDETQNNQR